MIGLGVICYISLLIIGMIAVFPYGLIGLLFLVGIGFLFVKVLMERLSNKEDEYYIRNVEK
ncbi:hypothetical protein KFU94_67310 [Chloroflexi bacterium TSY]|nr:hypothetical protein [Chloroflexi bacterium TSY]